jgi:hypothetical protein
MIHRFFQFNYTMNSTTKVLLVLALIHPACAIAQDRFLSRWDRYLCEIDEIRDGDPKVGEMLHFAVNRKWQDYLGEVAQHDNDSPEQQRLKEELLSFLRTVAPLPEWFEIDFRTGFHSDNGRYFFSPIRRRGREINKRFYSKDDNTWWVSEGKILSLALPWGKVELTSEFLQQIPTESYITGTVNIAKDRFALTYYDESEVGQFVELHSRAGFQWRQRLANPVTPPSSGQSRNSCSLVFSEKHVWLFALGSSFYRIQRFEEEFGNCDLLLDSRGFVNN